MIDSNIHVSTLYSYSAVYYIPTYECLDQDIEFYLVRWTTTSPSLYFEVNGDGSIVINESGTFFVYSQVYARLLS